MRVIELNKGIWLRGDILSTHRVLHFGPSANMLKQCLGVCAARFVVTCELELELIQTQMAQKPMLRAEVGMRVRCANKASAE